jgi:ABC-type cobalamin/Fe3+-siderophores transport system ATPase subunit
MTVVLVTHDPQLVAPYCDRMVMMEDGRLIQKDTGDMLT